MNPSKLFDKRVEDLGDWRGEVIIKLRQIVLEAFPEISEEWKWDTLVWSHNGLVAAVGVFKDNAGLNFFKGALIDDPKKLFNAGLEAKNSRSIRFFQGDKINEEAIKKLILAAVAQNLNKK